MCTFTVNFIIVSLDNDVLRFTLLQTIILETVAEATWILINGDVRKGDRV